MESAESKPRIASSVVSIIRDQTELKSKRHGNASRNSEQTMGSNYELSVHDEDEDFTGEWEEDYELSMSRTGRTSDATSKQCPLDENFFDVGQLSLLSHDFSEDTIETIESYVQPPLEAEEQDFFERLGEVPDIKQISLTNIEDEKYKTLFRVSSSVRGKFVDPLTGKIVPEKHPSEELLPEMEEGDEEKSKTGETKRASWLEEDIEEFSFDDFDTRFPVPVDKSMVQVPDAAEVALLFAATAQLSAQSLIVQPRVQPSLAADAVEQTEKFLHDLINYVTRKCEFELDTELLKKKLNKSALFDEIKKQIMDLVVEKKVNFFLNRKCVEYHRRKGNARYLHEEKPDKALLDMALYKEKVELLNKLLGKEAAMAQKTNNRISDLTEKSDSAQAAYLTEIASFENFVRKTMKSHMNPAFEKFVSSQLKLIADLREEIASTRSCVIHRQHNLGTLRARLTELENIGNGLRLADYENLQRDMQGLSKKIEDRNRELGKMHTRFHNNLHSMAHIKLKNETTVDDISEKVANLKDLEEEEYLKRTRLFHMNLAHQKIRRQLLDLSIQSGLLDKPVLCRDYDETMDRVLKQRQKVQELKKTHHELEAKMQQLNADKSTKTSKKDASKSESLKLKSSPRTVEGLEGICLNF